ncbi:MAG: ROK family protein [Acidobacteria bacterium]|nr:ROK family protein [Acidobacteriota bacterium]
METLYAAVDISGPKIAAATGTGAGDLLHVETAPFPSTGGPEAILASVATLLDALADSAGRRPAALGVAAPRGAGGWGAYPAAAFLEHSLRMPVRILHEAQCATLAESRYGHGREYPSFVLFILGTGISGGIVIDGKLRLGPHSAAGEIGHLTVQPSGPVCACGNAGCLEVVASGAAIARASGYPDAESAAGAARDGDDGAQRAIRDAGVFLGIAAANLVTALHPDAILFAGPMSTWVDLLLLPVRSAINERVRMFPAQDVAVRRAATGANAALLGALALNTAY